ncbi:hypothetical protein [Pseudomonas mandelii]
MHNYLITKTDKFWALTMEDAQRASNTASTKAMKSLRGRVSFFRAKLRR